jgi:alkylhydroperoxidase/carboxymuconolactone decarboxylase family protein YurZ
MTSEPDLPCDLATVPTNCLGAGCPADLIARISADAFEASGLDSDTVVLIWLAALVALDAPSESYLMNLGAASQAGVTLDRVHGVLTALGPIVGTPRVVSASFKISDVLEAGA